MNRCLVALLVVLATIAAVGCGDDSPEPAPAPPRADSEPPPADAELRCPLEGAGPSLDAEELEGLSLQEAEKQAGEFDCSVRVIERDGEPLPATLDYNPQRINVSVEGSAVIRVQSIG